MFLPFVTGQNLTAALLTGAFNNNGQLVAQSVDLTRNNTITYLDSTDLVIPVVAGTYIFESHFLYDTTSTADIKIRVSVLGGTGGLIARWGAALTVASSTNAIDQLPIGPTGNIFEFPYGGSAAGGGLMAALPTGYITPTAAGNVVIGVAQSTATAVSTLLKAGSFMRLTRVA